LDSTRGFGLDGKGERWASHGGHVLGWDRERARGFRVFRATSRTRCETSRKL
jgi:hypothetical protein